MNLPQEIKPSYELPELVKVVSQAEILQYAQASGDFNPLHLEGDYARASDFKGTIAHGMLLLGLIDCLHQRVFGNLWFWGSSLDVKFKRPVYPGDRIKIRSVVFSVAEKDNGKTVICHVNASKGCDTVLTGIATLNIRQEDSLDQ